MKIDGGGKFRCSVNQTTQKYQYQLTTTLYPTQHQFLLSKSNIILLDLLFFFNKMVHILTSLTISISFTCSNYPTSNLFQIHYSIFNFFNRQFFFHFTLTINHSFIQILPFSLLITSTDDKYLANTHLLLPLLISFISPLITNYPHRSAFHLIFPPQQIFSLTI